jgi:hypothetical protein
MFKKIIFSVAHVAVIGAGVAGSVFFPHAAPIIATGMGAVNALIPSPLSEVKSETPRIQSSTTKNPT